MRVAYARCSQGIAGRYDLLNHVLSGNVDKRWRRVLAERLFATLPDVGEGKATLLDVACGTGDLSFQLHQGRKRPSGRALISVDQCFEIAKSKANALEIELPFIEGDALNLPFGNGSFAPVTIAFGLRNLSSSGREDSRNSSEC